MLNRIRKSIQPVTDGIALRFASSGLSPNAFTLMGFFAAAVAGIMYALYEYVDNSYLYAGIILLISGFFDIVDGSLARVTNRVSKMGAFLDSTLDRVSEAVLFIGIMASGVVHPLLVVTALTLSFMVSYTRARGESIGINLQGIGIGERAERLLVLALFSIIAGIIDIQLVQYGIIIVALLAGVTFIHRLLSIFSAVDRHSSSPPQP